MTFIEIWPPFVDYEEWNTQKTSQAKRKHAAAAAKTSDRNNSLRPFSFHLEYLFEIPMQSMQSMQCLLSMLLFMAISIEHSSSHRSRLQLRQVFGLVSLISFIVFQRSTRKRTFSSLRRLPLP